MFARSTVMVVDDDEDALALATAMLARAGYDVVSAPTGRDALHILLAAPTLPEVVVLDMQMPLMDGTDVVRVIRSYRRLTALPIVLHSAYAPEWDALRLVQAFVPKTATRTQLLAAVRSFARATAPPIAG